MASSWNEASNTQTFTRVLMLASAIAALSSFLLFGLQPLAVSEMSHWHAPATVVHFFQWTYLVGVTLTALSSRLEPGPDLRLAGAVFMPVAAYTILMVMPTGPHRLGHLAPIAVWLACSSTVMVRALGRTPDTCRQRPYAILAFSNAGALLGVLVWLHPAHVPSSASWIIVGTIILIIGASLIVVVRKVGVPPLRLRAGEIGSVPKSGARVVLIWFSLAMSASLAMMLAHRHFVAMDESNPAVTVTHATGTALPLLVFLLAYVVGWSSAGTAGTNSGGRWFRHVIISALIAACTTAYDPPKAAVSVALYLFCTACVGLLRRCTPLPANATKFQIVQAAGGVGGGWLASYMK
jgi:hypothetical protein